MDHIFEIKWDGVRRLPVVENNTVRMQSRHLLEMTARFPELADLRELPDGTVFDRALMCHGGNPHLRKIQQRVHRHDRHSRIALPTAHSAQRQNVRLLFKSSIQPFLYSDCGLAVGIFL